MTEDDDSDVDRAEDGKLMRLLEKTAFPFQKGTVMPLEEPEEVPAGDQR